MPSNNYQPKPMGGEHMNRNPPNNNQMCKWGLDCHRNKQGQCRFSHPPMPYDQNNQKGGNGNQYNKNIQSPFIHNKKKTENYPLNYPNGQ